MIFSTIAFIIELNRRLSQDIAYQVRMEPGVQAPEETLARASGSCRDSGWLLVQILRRVGLAARFVSGYLIQLRPDGDDAGGPAQDFTDLHAWAEVYIPGAGWIGLDPTSGLLAGEGHLPLACTADPGNAAPVIGYTDVANVEFEFAMSVTRVPPQRPPPSAAATFDHGRETGRSSPRARRSMRASASSSTEPSARGSSKPSEGLGFGGDSGSAFSVGGGSGATTADGRAASARPVFE